MKVKSVDRKLAWTITSQSKAVATARARRHWATLGALASPAAPPGGAAKKYTLFSDKSKPCAFFLKGDCRNGDKCQWQHTVGDAATPAAEESRVREDASDWEQQDAEPHYEESDEESDGESDESDEDRGVVPM